MKKFLIILFLAFSLLACKKDPVNQITFAEGTVLEPSAVAKGENIVVKFNALAAWTVTINEDAASWCSVNTKEGKVGDGVFTIIVRENKTGVDRSTIIILQAGDTKEEIKVSQVPKSKEGDANVKDINFNNYLIENFDEDKDGKISNIEKLQIKTINCNDLGIKTLEGIEQYTNIDVLNCSDNEIESMDLSKNKLLFSLICANNKLTTLDLSGNPELTTILCQNNELTSINTSKNPKLGTLNASENKLTTLDLSQNGMLKILFLDKNELSVLDLSNNSTIETTVLNNNKLSAFACPSNILAVLDINNNAITTIDVSEYAKLAQLNCSDNPMTSLDITKNTSLRVLNCSNNPMMSLDITKNTKLLELDYSGITMNLDITKHLDLEILNCANTGLTTLDITKHKQIKTLDCSKNGLTTLDLSKNTLLESLICGENKLTTLDVSKSNMHNTDVEELLNCAPMTTLATLYLKKGWEKITNILPTRNDNFIPATTKIEFKD